MSGAHSVSKRQRSTTMGAAALSGPIDYVSLIRSLPAQILCDILDHAAQQHSDVGASIVNERNKIVAAEQAKTIDFDLYSKSAWRVLNAKHSRLSGSRQYEKSFEVVSEVQDCINAIGNATPAHANFGTKKSALETLRKIGKSISLCEAREVIKQFQYVNCLESTMLRIAKSMTVEERKAFMTEDFLDKLVELESLGAESCLFEELEGVRLALLGVQDSSADTK